MKPIKIILLCMSILLAPLVQAQSDYLERGASARKLIAMGLYPPDMIMKHQQELGITDQQRSNISALVSQFQGEVGELQWSLRNEQQLLVKSLSGSVIDEKGALAQAEKALEMETEFKLAHLKLLIAIKNELTEEQVSTIQNRLRQLRKEKSR